ncbi:MAG: Phage Mu protein F like protein [bacterium ADurb.Bin429]|nr:MAG: Phage Mu protein F like protein [bacterium ADurb.Bin429]
MHLQETLRLEYLDVSQRLAVEALLDELREAQARGETITPAMISRAAAAIAEAHSEAIRPTIIHSLQEMALVGVAAAADAFEGAVNFTLDWTLANTYAADWARTYGGQLITNMDATTKARIGAEVGAWAEAREGYPDLLKRIQAIIDDPRRAALIAQTEPTSAYAAGNEAAWRQEEDELGVVIIEVWNTANDDLVCPICGPLNQQQRRIGGTFEGGIERPAAHPRCRCWLTAMMVLTRAAIARYPRLDTIYKRFRRAADAG